MSTFHSTLLLLGLLCTICSRYANALPGVVEQRRAYSGIETTTKSKAVITINKDYQVMDGTTKAGNPCVKENFHLLLLQYKRKTLITLCTTSVDPSKLKASIVVKCHDESTDQHIIEFHSPKGECCREEFHLNKESSAKKHPYVSKLIGCDCSSLGKDVMTCMHGKNVNQATKNKSKKGLW